MVDDYIVDERLSETDRNQLLTFVNELQNVERSELDTIKGDLISEDYIQIHKGLQRLLMLLCTEIHQFNFPFNFGIAGINDQIVELIFQSDLVKVVLHIIDTKLSVQSSIDCSRIITGLFSGSKLQKIKLIQSGIMNSIAILLKDPQLFLHGLIMVQLAAKASKKFCVVFLKTPELSLIFELYQIHPILSLKCLYALCTRRVKMRFKLIKPVLEFLLQKIEIEVSVDHLYTIISIITGKWIPLPPITTAQQRRVQLIIDRGIVQKLVQLVSTYYTKGLLISAILTNFILILSGTPEQAQQAFDHGLIRAAIKCLNHNDTEVQRRSLVLMSHLSQRSFGAIYLYEQKSIISQMMNKLNDEVLEPKIQQLIIFFYNLVKYGDLNNLQTLIDQQILKILIKQIKLNLNIQNIQLNMTILNLLQTLFVKGKELDYEVSSKWKQEFLKNNGAAILVELVNKSQLLQEFDLDDF